MIGTVQQVSLIGGLLLLLVSLSNAFVERKCSVDSLRLQRHIKPDHYNLVIRPDLNQSTFQGNVSIDLRSIEDEHNCGPIKQLKSVGMAIEATRVHACNRSTIILHAGRDLQINWVDFVSDKNRDVMVKGTCRDDANEFIAINLDRELAPGSSGQLRLSFTGPIRDDQLGLYRPLRHSNPTIAHPMAVTQFEATHARKAFPCFDEPSLKSTFDLAIEHASHLKALSNMQPIGQQMIERNGDQLKRVKFARTPLMSTYLLGYAIGELDRVEATASDGMKIGVWTLTGQGGQEAGPLLARSVGVYTELRNEFDIEQPLEKIDFVSVPSGRKGGMENWGMITLFREPADSLSKTTEFIIHELVHQWFGNLVTMRWWDDVWLKEGITSWLTWVVNERLFPWAQHEVSYQSMLNDLLVKDTTNGTNAVRNRSVQTAAQIEATFSWPIYGKAPALLRTLSEYMGPESMMQGLRKYLHANSYKSVETNDLWDALEESSGKDVRKFMAPWIEQTGFPLITVKLTNDSRSLHLTQEKFASAESVSQSPPLKWWIIPLAMWISDGKSVVERRVTMGDRTMRIKLPDSFDIDSEGNWVKLNARSIGFYRVEYEDERLLGALERPIRDKKLAPADRVNIFCDTVELFQMERIPLKSLDEVHKWFESEEDNLISRTIFFCRWLRQSTLKTWSSRSKVVNPKDYSIMLHEI